MKDWNGNKNSLFTTNGDSNHSDVDREVNDYYATDPTAIDDLLKYEKFDEPIWEPACGEGHLSKRLKEFGNEVISTDLINRGYGEYHSLDFLKCNNIYSLDFLKCNQTPIGHIVTNPPYKYAQEFVEKSIELLSNKPLAKVAMFMKLTFLEGQKRRGLFDKYPPKTVYVYSKRKFCALNGEFKSKNDSAVAYAWYVWQIGFNCHPNIVWI